VPQAGARSGLRSSISAQRLVVRAAALVGHPFEVHGKVVVRVEGQDVAGRAEGLVDERAADLIVRRDLGGGLPVVLRPELVHVVGQVDAELDAAQHGEADCRLQVPRVRPLDGEVGIANGAHAVRPVLGVRRDGFCFPDHLCQELSYLGRPGVDAAVPSHGQGPYRTATTPWLRRDPPCCATSTMRRQRACGPPP
jgi:hypothetical protein